MMMMMMMMTTTTMLLMMMLKQEAGDPGLCSKKGYLLIYLLCISLFVETGNWRSPSLRQERLFIIPGPGCRPHHHHHHPPHTAHLSLSGGTPGPGCRPHHHHHHPPHTVHLSLSGGTPGPGCRLFMPSHHHHHHHCAYLSSL